MVVPLDIITSRDVSVSLPCCAHLSPPIIPLYIEGLKCVQQGVHGALTLKHPKFTCGTVAILHALLDIEEYDSLLANPVAGASWEGFVIENIINCHRRWQASFVRTSNGAEIDLLLERSGRRHLFECKLSKAPKPSRGFYELTSSIQPDSAWVVAPVDEPYEIKKGI